MIKIYSGALFLCSVLGLSAQEVIWQKNIKSSSQDFLSQITTTIDGQYLISGSSIQQKKMSAENQQNDGYDFHLIKLNQQGNEVWEKYFSGQDHDFLSATVNTQEGGFLLAGTSFSGKGLDKKDDSKGGSDIWLIRINENGDEIWQKTLGSRRDEEAKAVIQATDLGFFVSGTVETTGAGFGSKDIWIIKLDKSGKELSQVTIGGKGLDVVEKMIPTKDGGALIGAYSRSKAGGSKKTDNFGEGDYWILKFDKDGKLEWEKNFGGKEDDHLRTISVTSSGFFIAGESRSDISGNKSVGVKDGTDLWMIMLNEKGEEIWQKSYNFKNRDVLMGASVLHTSDDKLSKGILLGGYSQAEGAIGDEEETFWILYLDYAGNEMWRKYVKGESRKKIERLADLKLNRDGSILLAGTSAEELGKENWKIIKLGDKEVSKLIEKSDIKIYPNPVTDYAYVEIGFEFKEADISLYDMGGRQIQTIKTRNSVTKINTQSLLQAVYLVHIKTDEGKVASAKLIKK
ncbi:T9SS type A sorting domain-containing protein [Chryseobacterium sp. PET-29]|uniref:T9SS type A sorting domain-containing protein n=1 Tax=Chryseobacterium sp. PET-29 TaxID=2983267 RepID=UPI0021E5F874|nr:T9SS type A sorting domain-containing protein [Chryseobacterium sp. PET-29]